MTRVLVAAASAIARAGLEAIVSRESTLALVGGTATIATLAEEVVECEPDVVLLELAAVDVAAPLGALGVLTVDAEDADRAPPPVVVLTDERDPGRLSELLRAGVRAVLGRNASAAEILAAIGAAAAGLVVLERDWLDAVAPTRGVAATAAAPDASVRQTPLSARELEVLRMIADGLANKQIAARLGISEHTVKFHVASVFAKLHASTRAEAVMTGARRGLIVL